LMFSISNVLWRYLPELQFLQFPWRWLIVLTVPFAVLVASVAKLKTIFFWFVAVFICTAAVALAVKGKWGGHDVTTVSGKFASGAGYFSTNKLTPNGSSRFTLPARAPLPPEV